MWTGFRNWTQVISPGGKCLYLMSHLRSATCELELALMEWNKSLSSLIEINLHFRANISSCFYEGTQLTAKRQRMRSRRFHSLNASLSVPIPKMGTCLYRATWGAVLKNRLKRRALSLRDICIIEIIIHSPQIQSSWWTLYNSGNFLCEDVGFNIHPIPYTLRQLIDDASHCLSKKPWECTFSL